MSTVALNWLSDYLKPPRDAILKAATTYWRTSRDERQRARKTAVDFLSLNDTALTTTMLLSVRTEAYACLAAMIGFGGYWWALAAPHAWPSWLTLTVHIVTLAFVVSRVYRFYVAGQQVRICRDAYAVRINEILELPKRARATPKTAATPSLSAAPSGQPTPSK